MNAPTPAPVQTLALMDGVLDSVADQLEGLGLQFAVVCWLDGRPIDTTTTFVASLPEHRDQVRAALAAAHALARGDA